VLPSHLLMHVSQQFCAAVTVLCCKVIVFFETMAGLLPGMLWVAAGFGVSFQFRSASHSNSHSAACGLGLKSGPIKICFWTCYVEMPKFMLCIWGQLHNHVTTQCCGSMQKHWGSSLQCTNVQAQGEVPKQHFALPYAVAGPACLPDSAAVQAVSLQRHFGQAARGDETAMLQASTHTVGGCRGTKQVSLLSRHSVLR